VSRAEVDRLDDIRVACEAIMSYAARSGVPDDLVFDAIRIRLVEIGEAVKDLGEPTRRLEPGIPWAEITRMRDLLAHRYFDTPHAIVTATARNDIPELADTVSRLQDRLGRARLSDGRPSPDS